MGLLDSLGYEQRKALKLLAEKPGIEGSRLCSEADCSWDEMFQLAEYGLIEAGADRITPQRMHPLLTDLGRQAIAAMDASPPAAGAA